MCQGFSHFSVFLHHFVVPKLATSGIRVKESSFITVDLCDELLILTESGWPLHLIQPVAPGALPYPTLLIDTCPASEKAITKDWLFPKGLLLWQQDFISKEHIRKSGFEI